MDFEPSEKVKLLGEQIERFMKEHIYPNEALAHQQMEDLGWRSIDVSYMAVEEIARRVMDLCGLRGRS